MKKVGAKVPGRNQEEEMKSFSFEPIPAIDALSILCVYCSTLLVTNVGIIEFRIIGLHTHP